MDFTHCQLLVLLSFTRTMYLNRLNWSTDISLRHSRNRAKCIIYHVCFPTVCGFSLVIHVRARACHCHSSGC